MVDVVRGKPPATRGVVEYIQREILTVPNALTAFRFGAGIAIFIWTETLSLVAVLAFLGAVSDGLDGFFARLLKQETDFGKKLDQVTDLVFGLSLVYAIGYIDGPTWYNVPVGVAIIAFSIGMVYLRSIRWVMNSSAVSKQRIALQFVSAIAIIAAHAFPASDSGVVILLGYVGLWYSIYMMWRAFVGYWKKSD